MKVHFFSWKQIKWIFLAGFFALVVYGVNWTKRYTASEIEWYQLNDKLKSKGTEVQPAKTGSLIINAAISPCSFTVDLGTKVRKGACALWIYGSQGNNEETLIIEYDGKVIGTIDNQPVKTQGGIAPRLFYVGDITISRNNGVFKFTGYASKKDHYYADLGGF